MLVAREESAMFVRLVNWVRQVIHTGVQLLRKQISIRTKPMNVSLVRGSLGDLVRTKPQLVAENALLRQQLIVLNRRIKRPHLTPTDRSLLVLLASRVLGWKEALLIVKPDTLLRWHRHGFRVFWRWRSRAGSRAPRIPAVTIALIKEMAANNRLL
jgi:putative transposase